MFSNSSKYAIKAVLYLAQHSCEKRKILTKHISESILVPNAYLAKLLQELARHGIVSSSKGPKGGFYLNQENRQQPLINLIDVIDGQQKLKTCILGLKNCDEKRPCPVHHLIADSKKSLINSLEHRTIAEISSDIEKGISFFPL